MRSKRMEEVEQYPCNGECSLSTLNSTIMRLSAVREQLRSPFPQFRSTARGRTRGSTGLHRKSQSYRRCLSQDRSPFEREPPDSLLSFALSDTQPWQQRSSGSTDRTSHLIR